MGLVSNDPRVRGKHSVSSLSVALPNENNSCRNNDENCYVSCGRGDFRSAKRAKGTDYEADFLQQEMQRLKIGDYNTSEQAVRGSDPNDTKILERGDGTEEPAFVKLKFEDFDRIVKNMEVDRENISEMLAYKLAKKQNEAFVDDPQFKIGFLRADRYDATRAAKRMLRYLKIKLDLFGIRKLTSDICLEDIGEDGKRFLLVGDFQILPERDEAGRLILFVCDTLTKEDLDRQREGIKKALFYLFECLHDDTEMGKIKGFVTVLWRVHKEDPPDEELVKVIDDIGICCRPKLSAHHMCRPKTHRVNLQQLNAYSKMLLPALKNARILKYFRSHYGTGQECKYTLKTKYGIDCLPIQEGIDNDTNSNRPIHSRYAKEWVSKRTEIEFARKHAVLLDAVVDDDISDDGSFENTLKNLESLGNVVSSDGSFENTLKNLESLENVVSSDGSFENALKNLKNLPTVVSSDGSFENALKNLKSLPTVVGSDHSLENTLNDLKSLPNVVSSDHSLSKDSTVPSSSMTIKGCDIRPNDVLLGQARYLRGHPGNIRFRQMVEDSFDRFFDSRKMEKTQLNREIAHQIERDGGRFLKQTTSDGGGLWVEVSDDEAHKKVASTFRNIVKKKKREREE